MVQVSLTVAARRGTSNGWLAPRRVTMKRFVLLVVLALSTVFVLPT